MSSFDLKVRAFVLLAFSTFSAIAYSEVSPVLPQPLPPTNGGSVALNSPVLPQPLPPTNGGSVAVNSPVLPQPLPPTNGGSVA